MILVDRLRSTQNPVERKLRVGSIPALGTTLQEGHVLLAFSAVADKKLTDSERTPRFGPWGQGRVSPSTAVAAPNGKRPS